jgi:release factor glutamine methyltransferase
MVDSSRPDIAGALQWARGHIDAVDARVLMRHVLQCPAARLVSHPESVLTQEEWQHYQSLVGRRQVGEPVAYLVGEREFYGYSFLVNPAVLIPRPETELLIELALAHFGDKPGTRVLDLGTGSGAIALTLARELPSADVVAVDRSREALQVAVTNALRMKVSVSFVLSDWFSALGGDSYDLIVANPPYIAANDPHLQEGDVRFEPSGALASGPLGLDDLAVIATLAPRYLTAGGWLFMEHGYDQASRVRGLLTDAGFTAIQSWQDLAGIERVTGGRWDGRDML